MKPMRVLMVSEPGRYGVMIYVKSLIEFLHRAHPEITVDYAYSSERGSPGNEALIAQVEKRGGRTFDMCVSNMPTGRDLSAALGIWKLVKRTRPDVIHAHSSKAGALARSLRLLGLVPPVLYSPHGYYGMSMRGGMKDRIFNTVETLLGRRGWSHNISIHEREFARNVLQVPANQALLIFSGVDLDRFAPVDASEKRRLREELGLPPEARILVTVGRDVYEKNYGDLYRALDQVLPELPGVSFVHAGGGSPELKARLSGAAREQVTAFSYLDRPEHLLQAADGFVLVSRTEAFGLVAFEAMGCGLPLILTGTMGLLTLKALNFPGIRWLPNPAEHGDVSRDIGEAIRSWASAGAEKLPERSEMRRWFDSATQFEKLVRAYRSLVEGTGSVEELEDTV